MAQVVEQVRAWEDKAQALFSIRKPTIHTVSKLIKEAKGISAHLPSKKKLKNILKAGKKWKKKVKAANNLINGPFIDVYEDLIYEAQKLNLDITHSTNQIQKRIDSVRSWRQTVASTFLKHNSSLSLMEALAPRTDIGKEIIHEKQRRFVIHGVELFGETTPHEVDAAFKEAEKLELNQMRQLRIQNCRKRADNLAPYCICRMKGVKGIMLECSLCKDKFHYSCLQMGYDDTSMTRSERSELDEMKFLCPSCERTKRPKLDILVELVKSMKEIKVRIPEGEALQRLTERAMNWQGRAEKLLNTPEMLPALHGLKVPLPPSIAMPIPPENKFNEKATKIEAIILMKDHEYSSSMVLTGKPRMSESGYSQLKELMIEGELMEVQFEEATFIWKLLQIFKKYFYNIWDDAYEEAEKQHKNDRAAVLAELRQRSRMPMRKRIARQPRPTKATQPKPNRPNQTTESTQLEPNQPNQTTESTLLEPNQPNRTTESTQLELNQPNRTTESTQLKPNQPNRTTEATQLKPNRPNRTTESTQPKPNRPNRTTEVTQLKPNRRNRTTGTEATQLEPNRPNRTAKATLLEPNRPNQTTKATQLELKQTKKKPETITSTGRPAKRTKKAEDAANDENICGDECAAKPCRRPTGKKLNWVQCDGCELWFHIKCIGQRENDLADDEPYFCCNCS